MNLTDDRIDIVWKATRLGARIVDVTIMFSCSREEAIELYSAGVKKYGYGTRETRHQVSITAQEPPPRWTRPPAIYSNPDYSNSK